MPRRELRLNGLVAATIAAVVASAGPARAVTQTYVDLFVLYSHYSMMDAVAKACFAMDENDPAYLEAGEKFKQDNLPLRDELDSILAASGEAPEVVDEANTAGVKMAGQVRSPTACKQWLQSAKNGFYNGETYFAREVGRLRETQ